MVLFTRFIEAGRLCVIQYGDESGKLCFIVDIINANRVLVDGGNVTGVARQAMPIRRLALTDHKVTISRGIRTATLAKSIKDSGVLSKFGHSTWGKRLVLKRRKSEMTDFDRFKLATLKTQKAVVKRRIMKKLKKGITNLPESRRM